jgi:methanogenic corrinoid protein MtbC1
MLDVNGFEVIDLMNVPAQKSIEAIREFQPQVVFRDSDRHRSHEEYYTEITNSGL